MRLQSTIATCALLATVTAYATNGVHWTVHARDETSRPDELLRGLVLIQVHADKSVSNATLMPEDSPRRGGENALQAKQTEVHLPLPIDLVPDEARLQRGHGSVLLAPQQRRHFHFVAFAKSLLLRDGTSPTPQTGEHYANLPYWSLGFFCSLALLGLLTRYICSLLEVKIDLPDDDDLTAVRGRPCWVAGCAAIVFLLASTVFWMTVISIRMVNQEIIRQPTYTKDTGSGNVTVTRSPIVEPGRNGLEAGWGVALSAAAACVLTFSWRWRGQVQIKAALLAQFTLRGATLSACIAMLLEIVGEALLASTGIAERGLDVGNALMMLIVGASEESAKLFAVVAGTWLSAAALKCSTNQADCCSPLWRMLVESPRALVLAGFCAGFGFMIIENVEYMMAVASTPPMEYSSDEENEGATALMIISIFTICVRVVLNLHPWLTGVSAGRVARICFADGREHACPSFSEMLWAIAPSSITHAMFDFLVGGPGIIAVFMPLLFWYASRWMFMYEFEEVKNVSRTVVGQKAGDSIADAKTVVA